jgi:hypothetical protein
MATYPYIEAGLSKIIVSFLEASLHEIDKSGLPEQKTIGYVQFFSHGGDCHSEETSCHTTCKRDAAESGD